MGKLKLIMVLIIIVSVFIACSKKKEMEYYDLAKTAYSKEDFKGALENFKLLIENYPEGEKTAEAAFMLGFINANNTKDFEAAEKHYKEFIAKHPNHDLTDDAEYELQNLGKDLNELPMLQKIKNNESPPPPPPSGE
jgi:TolA-binding protein